MNKKSKQKIDFRNIQNRIDTLEWFKNVQLSKLVENAHKGSWENSDKDYLLSRMNDEIIELKEALKVGNHFEIIRECADIANFSMMIASLYKNEK